MAYADSDHPSPAGIQAVRVVKLLIAGGFGVGKTTMVTSLSEITPLRTEEQITERSVGVDDLTGVESKTTTTVALDFGRITIGSDLVMYLFGTPGQDRFWFMWDELSTGALGAVVLADTRRLDGAFAPVDFFESRGIPFVVAVNCFDDADIYYEDEIRGALDLPAHVPVLMCDVRLRESAKQVVVALMEHLMTSAVAQT
ncbi:ATP/GTP-binding protein [Nocardia sp. NPDC050378]|uniref:GTP-binding protein n=1 Tax=Nocardia sp. NPDC050378 TaxID=3155400 RepID=UPI0034002993